jgi:hypothetical protein
MFQYLCKRNESEVLKLWLLNESNYFYDGVSPSPMSLTTVVCSEVFNAWLQVIDNKRTREIYAGFLMKDLIAITRLPIQVIHEICDNLIYKFTKKLPFNSAILKEGAFTTIDDFTKLFNKQE